MNALWYVWIDGIPRELSTAAKAGIFRNLDRKNDWLPLVLCDDELKADAVSDALAQDQSDTIKRWNLTVYRNPLDEQTSPEHIAAIKNKILEVERLSAIPGAMNSQLSILVRRAIELKIRMENQP